MCDPVLLWQLKVLHITNKNHGSKRACESVDAIDRNLLGIFVFSYLIDTVSFVDTGFS